MSDATVIKMSPEEEAQWQHRHHENGADWLRKYVPNASKFGCKIAEMLKVTCLGGLEPMKKRLLKSRWTDDACIDVSVSSDCLNQASETNHLFMLLHLCNQMNITCHVSGMSFNNLRLYFRKKLVSSSWEKLEKEGKLKPGRGPMGSTGWHVEIAVQYAHDFGGCVIEDFGIRY